MDLKRASLNDLKARYDIRNKAYTTLVAARKHVEAHQVHRELTFILNEIKRREKPKSTHRPLSVPKMKTQNHVSADSMAKFEPSDYTLGL